MVKNISSVMFTGILFIFCLMLSDCNKDNSKVETIVKDSCSHFGTPPMQTVFPVTMPLDCEDGEQLTWQQGSTIRYACLNYPDNAAAEKHQWPMIVYLHGSIATPMSLYTFARDFFDLRQSAQLSDDNSVKGFIILSPEGRIANPYKADDFQSGEGFHWDEWHRDPAGNIDAQSIDHFIQMVVNTGKVDTSRIYVIGWSNGAYMTVLYSTWRSNKIAAMAQYAGANPWTRPPCPVPMTYTKQVPLFLMRNLCDALVPCDSTESWIKTLKSKNWPFEYHNLNNWGDTVSSSLSCYLPSDCPKAIGFVNHCRWPKTEALNRMIEFLKAHPLSNK